MKTRLLGLVFLNFRTCFGVPGRLFCVKKQAGFLFLSYFWDIAWMPGPLGEDLFRGLPGNRVFTLW
ncbi:hypothetical protein C7120_00465 [Prevotella sp. oral taxon 376]|nr:hypothetical protein C7120_00465 [Prevotella sp. oral taxon 376]